VVAFNPGTGQIKGHFQYHPTNSWDWDEVSPPLIVDYRRDGRTVKGLVNVARNGYLWQLERTRDKINFVAGQPYVRQKCSRVSIPGRTARRRRDAQAGHQQTASSVRASGGQEWPPPRTAAKRGCFTSPPTTTFAHSSPARPEIRAGERFQGVAKNVLKMVAGADQSASCRPGISIPQKGMDDQHAVVQLGSGLATGGGLLFAGGTNDACSARFDAGPQGCGSSRPPRALPGAGIVPSRRQAIYRGGNPVGASTSENANAHEPDLPASIRMFEGGAVWVFAVK